MAEKRKAATKVKTVKKKAAKKKVVEKAVEKTAKKAVKKAVKKKVAKKKVVKKKVGLNAKDIAYFTQLLLEKRKEILGDLNDMENEALRKSRLGASGDLSSMPIHMADIGSDNYEQEFTLDLLDSERKMLVKIHDAMLRIQDGTYGICDGTGEPIARARLEAKPWAKYGIKYAQMLENGEVLEDEYPNED